MIKTLKKRFIFNSMLAITILLLVLLGAINGVNILSVHRETANTLEMISASDGDPKKLSPSPEEKPFHAPPVNGFKPVKNKYDTFMSSNFFLVKMDPQGEVLFSDVSRTSRITQEEAEQLAMKAFASGYTEGKFDSYRYRITDNSHDITLVFLDVAGEVSSYVRVLLLSIAGGSVCWFCMLLLVILLAKKAIQPIAENIEKQKQFITDAGHEIKTPLAIIQANAEAMDLINGENKWSRNIKDQTIRLSGLMQNLLLLARMEEDLTPLPKEELAIDQLTEEIIESFLQSMELKEIAVTKSIQSPLHWTGNRQYYSQLLSILLDNASKYTDRGGELLLSLTEANSRIRLLVENTCTAVPEEDPDRLFDRFYRSDKARTQKNGGYGIGLAAAKSIAANCSGTIHAEYLSPTRIRFIVEFEHGKPSPSSRS